MEPTQPPPLNPPATDPKPAGKVPGTAHLICGWPLILVLFGGLIGGGLGGAAYCVNLAIYKSRLPVAAKILLNLATGAAAFVFWLVIVAAIVRARK
jgi:hypothetical protein